MALQARIEESGVINSNIGRLEYKYNKVSRDFAGYHPKTAKACQPMKAVDVVR